MHGVRHSEKVQRNGAIRSLSFMKLFRKACESKPESISIEDAQEIVSHISYIDGTIIHVLDENGYIENSDGSRDHGPMLAVESVIIGVGDGLASTLMSRSSPLQLTSRKEFVDQVFSLCQWAAIHEVQEWFKVDGVNWVDPHPKPQVND